MSVSAEAVAKREYAAPIVTVLSLSSLCKIEASMCYNDGRAYDYGSGYICDCGGHEACGAGCHCSAPGLLTAFQKLTRNKLTKQNVYEILTNRYSKDSQWNHIYYGSDDSVQVHCWEQAGFSSTDRSQLVNAYAETIYEGSLTESQPSIGLYESVYTYNFNDYTLKLWGSWILTSENTILGSDAYIIDALVNGA